ncbi:ATP-binding cassette domain-containing protein, partial [Candidatus Sumerlaeota bacterium]|nr:ATP-binding cassette domain-containing protein [Candidatus Sumerlaeota bacterium]
MTPPLLEIRNFECKTKQGAAVFTPLEFSLFPGDAVLVEGGSGTGKSSLLFGIRGIPLSDRKYAGDVLFNGKPASSGDRKRFGLVLQNPHAQAVSTLVKEELGEDAGEAIDILDLRGILDAPVRSLSAGQKHLASIAAAGRGEFPFIMMDEPFLYLDRDNAERALRFIDHLRNKGKCLIVTSHPGIVPRKDFTTAIEMNPPVLNGMGKDANFGEAGEDRFVDKTGALLELENADIGYPGFPAVLRGLSVSLKGGEELWIYGGNGSGKTTLLKAISG